MSADTVRQRVIRRRNGAPCLASETWDVRFSVFLRSVLLTLTLFFATSFAVAQNPATCRFEIIEGEVHAGQIFERSIGNGVKLILQPLPSGWVLRVLPQIGPRGAHDYAELATPPYRSVSPLLISTDFSFRAQDALAWNPRSFHFAADRASFLELERAYGESENAASNPQAQRAAEARLAELAARSPEGELTLLDAHLVQGTADQAGTAALVASHLNSSAHEVDQPAVVGGATPLGRLNWIRFRIRLTLPKGFQVDHGTSVQRGKCL